MSDDVFVNSETMTEIANAIREKTGKTELMYPRDMAGEIDGIDISEAENTDAEWFFRTLKTVTWSEGLTEITANFFKDCTDLDVAEIPDTVQTIAEAAFSNCVSLSITKLPEALTTIGSGAFSGCTNLRITRIPASVTTIGSYVSATFGKCLSLTEITFGSKPESYTDSFSGGMFAGCDNLLVINVPWAEDELAGAPWGARNATINYNYSE